MEKAFELVGFGALAAVVAAFVAGWRARSSLQKALQEIENRVTKTEQRLDACVDMFSTRSEKHGDILSAHHEALSKTLRGLIRPPTPPPVDPKNPARTRISPLFDEAMDRLGEGAGRAIAEISRARTTPIP